MEQLLQVRCHHTATQGARRSKVFPTTDDR